VSSDPLNGSLDIQSSHVRMSHFPALTVTLASREMFVKVGLIQTRALPRASLGLFCHALVGQNVSSPNGSSVTHSTPIFSIQIVRRDLAHKTYRIYF
jgi:hypothetical protein